MARKKECCVPGCSNSDIFSKGRCSFHAKIQYSENRRKKIFKDKIENPEKYTLKTLKPLHFKKHKVLKANKKEPAAERSGKATAKESKLPVLIKKLDAVFSKFIRLKDSDDNGNVNCFTCGVFGSWKTFDCGHYISRRFLNTRFNELNCKVQCRTCNQLKSGEVDIFEKRLDEVHGEGTAEKIFQLSKKSLKFDRMLLNSMLSEYFQKFENELLRRNFK